VENFLGVIVECLQDVFFWRGVIAGAVALVVVWGILKFILSLRHRVKAIIVQEEGGTFVISRRALQEFLSGVVGEINGAKLVDVILTKRSEGKVRVDMKLSLTPGGDLNAIHGGLRQRVLDEAQAKLGIGDRIESVNMLFVKMPPSNQVCGENTQA